MHAALRRTRLLSIRQTLRQRRVPRASRQCGRKRHAGVANVPSIPDRVNGYGHWGQYLTQMCPPYFADSRVVAVARYQPRVRQVATAALLGMSTLVVDS